MSVIQLTPEQYRTGLHHLARLIVYNRYEWESVHDTIRRQHRAEVLRTAGLDYDHDEALPAARRRIGELEIQLHFQEAENTKLALANEHLRAQADTHNTNSTATGAASQAHALASAPAPASHKPSKTVAKEAQTLVSGLTAPAKKGKKKATRPENTAVSTVIDISTSSNESQASQAAASATAAPRKSQKGKNAPPDPSTSTSALPERLLKPYEPSFGAKRLEAVLPGKDASVRFSFQHLELLHDLLALGGSRSDKHDLSSVLFIACGVKATDPVSAILGALSQVRDRTLAVLVGLRAGGLERLSVRPRLAGLAKDAEEQAADDAVLRDDRASARQKARAKQRIAERAKEKKERKRGREAPSVDGETVECVGEVVVRALGLAGRALDRVEGLEVLDARIAEGRRDALCAITSEVGRMITCLIGAYRPTTEYIYRVLMVPTQLPGHDPLSSFLHLPLLPPPLAQQEIPASKQPGPDQAGELTEMGTIRPADCRDAICSTLLALLELPSVLSDSSAGVYLKTVAAVSSVAQHQVQHGLLCALKALLVEQKELRTSRPSAETAMRPEGAEWLLQAAVVEDVLLDFAGVLEESCHVGLEHGYDSTEGMARMPVLDQVQRAHRREMLEILRACEEAVDAFRPDGMGDAVGGGVEKGVAAEVGGETRRYLRHVLGVFASTRGAEVLREIMDELLVSA